MTKNDSVENNEYYIPGTEIFTWEGGLYFLPDKIEECSRHPNCNAIFTFEAIPNSNDQRKLYSVAQWCIRHLEESGHDNIIPKIKKFFEDHPDLALEI